jgi:hypothetical protein
MISKHKRATIAAKGPLRDPGILQHIFSFVPGHWLFLGAVCREWEAIYACVADQQVLKLSLYGSFASHPLITYGSKTTLYSAAVASPAATRLARRCGLAVRSNKQL